MSSEALEAWQASPETAIEEGVWAALNLCDPIALAIDNNWTENGEEKLENLYNSVLDLFESNKGIDSSEVEDFLVGTIVNDFNVDPQDGSVPWLAKVLCQLHVDCLEKKDFTGLLKLLEASEQKHAKAFDAGEMQDGGAEYSDDGKEEEEVPSLIPGDEDTNAAEEDQGDTGLEEAMDGWEVVGKKGKKNRR